MYFRNIAVEISHTPLVELSIAFQALKVARELSEGNVVTVLPDGAGSTSAWISG